MLIDLFRDSRLILNNKKNIAALQARKCDVVDDLSYYEEVVAGSADSEFHIKSVLENKDHERDYREFFGKITDTHNEIEKLGVVRYAKPYTTIVSLEDSLDYILHRLCKADMERVRQIRDYTALSRALFKLNFEGLRGFYVNDLLDVDPNLDRFITGLQEKAGANSEEFLLSLMRHLIMEVGSVSEYVSVFYNEHLGKGSSVIRSKSLCSFVLSTDKKMNEVLKIVSEGYSDYELYVRSFEKKEYYSSVDLRYAVGG